MAPTGSLRLTRAQILAFRRRVGALDRRLPPGENSLRQAAWAGLQDSMPRAALLSIHARVEGTGPSTWDDPSLVQVWGPRFSVYVVAARDLAVFTVGRMTDAGKAGRTGEELAVRLAELLGTERMRYDDAGEALGVPPNRLRYAALTGTLALRWEGARRPVVWVVPRPEIEPADATVELCRRFLHVFGPGTAAGFANWAGIGVKTAARALADLGTSALPVRAPYGDAWILAADEPTVRDAPAPGAPCRLLPSGDTYTLGVTPEERALLVPDAVQRGELWTPRVWPGAVLVDGKVVGTWRRDQGRLTVSAWQRLTRAARDAVVAEAESLPLPDVAGRIVVAWS